MLVSLQEIAHILRRTEEQVMDLMKEKKIGYNTTPGGMYLFSPEQVLSKVSPLEVEAPKEVVAPVVTPEVGIPADKPSEKKPVTSTKKGRKRG